MKSMSFSWLRFKKKNRRNTVFETFFKQRTTEKNYEKQTKNYIELKDLKHGTHFLNEQIDISVDWVTFRNKCVFSQLKWTFSNNAMRYAQKLDFIWHRTIFRGPVTDNIISVHPFNSILSQSRDGYANVNYVNENPCCKMSTWTAIAKS